MRRLFASRAFPVVVLLASVIVAFQWPRSLGYVCAFALVSVVGWFALRPRDGGAERSLNGGTTSADGSYTPLAGDVFGARDHSGSHGHGDSGASHGDSGGGDGGGGGGDSGGSH